MRRLIAKKERPGQTGWAARRSTLNPRIKSQIGVTGKPKEFPAGPPARESVDPGPLDSNAVRAMPNPNYALTRVPPCPWQARRRHRAQPRVAHRWTLPF